MIRIFILTILLVANIFALEKIYFLPEKSDEVKTDIVNYIRDAKDSIDIAMYNFNYKKFGKELDKAVSRGVEVTIYYYKKKMKFDKRIRVLKVKNKLHTKIAIFDKRIVIFGSANWKKEAFSKNYEVLYITDKKKIVKEFNNFFANIKRN